MELEQERRRPAYLAFHNGFDTNRGKRFPERWRVVSNFDEIFGGGFHREKPKPISNKVVFQLEFTPGLER